MKKQKLPRGLTIRKNSITASFALPDGTIARRSVGTVGVTSPQECQRKLFQFLREVELGTYSPPKARVKVTAYRGGDLWTVYLRAYRNEGGKDAGRLGLLGIISSQCLKRCASRKSRPIPSSGTSK